MHSNIFWPVMRHSLITESAVICSILLPSSLQASDGLTVCSSLTQTQARCQSLVTLLVPRRRVASVITGVGCFGVPGWKTSIEEMEPQTCVLGGSSHGAQKTISGQTYHFPHNILMTSRNFGTKGALGFPGGRRQLRRWSINHVS